MRGKESGGKRKKKKKKTEKFIIEKLQTAQNLIRFLSFLILHKSPKKGFQRIKDKKVMASKPEKEEEEYGRWDVFRLMFESFFGLFFTFGQTFGDSEQSHGTWLFGPNVLPLQRHPWREWHSMQI